MVDAPGDFLNKNYNISTIIGTNKNLKAVFYRISSDASNTKNSKTSSSPTEEKRINFFFAKMMEAQEHF
jgi:hypothetical protein